MEDEVVPISPTEPVPYNNHLDNLYGVLFLFSFLFGTVGNAMALFYFTRKKQDIPTIIYTSVVTVDMLISILVLPVGVSLFDDRNKALFSNQIVCDIWGFVWTALSRMSVFLVALLSASRAYFLTFPFRMAAQKQDIVGIIMVGSVVHVVGSSIPLWYHDNHVYHKAIACCSSFTDDYMPDEAVIATKVFDYVGIFLPVPVIVVSLILAVFQLSRRTVAGGGDDCKRNATVTITIFTGTYLFFNVPAGVTMLLFNFTNVIPWPDQIYLIQYIFILVIPLNAACNPIIYFWRMERMRTWLLSCIGRRSTQDMDQGVTRMTGIHETATATAGQQH